MKLFDGTVVGGSSTRADLGGVVSGSTSSPTVPLGRAEPMEASLGRAKRVGAAAALPVVDTVNLLFGGRPVGAAEPALQKAGRKLREYAYEQDPGAAQVAELVSSFGAPAKALAVGAGKLGMAALPVLVRQGPAMTKKAIEEAGGFRNFIKAYHGTGAAPFRKFTMEKIGTGEGAQSYGHGLYFAENPQVAKSYKVDTGVAANSHLREAYDLVEELEASGLSRTEAYKKAASQLTGSAKRAVESGALEAMRGSLYETRLKVSPEELLDWDKPLSEQSAMIQRTIQRLLGGGRQKPLTSDEPLGQLTGADVYRLLQSETRFGTKEAASFELQRAGIPGLRYLDQGSRGSRDGTRNIVMFSDDKVEVTSINGIPVEEFEARTGIKLASALAALGLSGAAASEEPR